MGKIKEVIWFVALLVNFEYAVPMYWKYIGCFNDNQSDRAFPAFIVNRPSVNESFSVTVQSCQHFAQASNQKAIGYQSEGECWTCPDIDLCNIFRHGAAVDCNRHQNHLKMHVFVLDNQLTQDPCDDSYPYDCERHTHNRDLVAELRLLAKIADVNPPCEDVFKEILIESTHFKIKMSQTHPYMLSWRV